MRSLLLRNTAPLLALFIFVIGNGFLSTFIASELTHRQESTFLIGLMTSLLYAGLVLGSFRIEKLIARVAHIRAYAAFASIAAIVALLHGIFENVYIWLLLRFICGLATAGIFIVVESWLLVQSTPSTRGRVLSFYMVTFYAAQALGQLLLGLDNSNTALLFAIISICSSLSIIPLALTKTITPAYCEPSTLSIGRIYRKCASGLFGCLIAGLILAAIYGLFPVFLIQNFATSEAVATGMFIIIFGGMALQYPIGKLSDIIERRIVLLAISLCCIAVLLAMLVCLHHHMLFLILCALLGGFTFVIYPISISHACDSLDPQDIIAGTQTLLLTYSIGAMLGPIIAPLFIKFSTYGLIIYLITMSALLVVFLSWRKTVSDDTPQEEAFISFPQNTPIGCEVDPRSLESDATTQGNTK